MSARVVLLVGLLPPGNIKNALLRRLGWRIGRDVRVGPCLVVRVEDVILGPGSRIGPCTVLRDLRRVALGSGARLGRWNWVSAAPSLRTGRSDTEAVLVMEAESAVTSRHYLDAAGGIRIGAFATVAGVRSTIITHGIDLEGGAQSTAAVTIGSYALVSSNSRLVPGANVPDHSLVAMGAVVTPGLTEPYVLYAGVPARARRALDRDARYFLRDRGPVADPA